MTAPEVTIPVWAVLLIGPIFGGFLILWGRIQRQLGELDPKVTKCHTRLDESNQRIEEIDKRLALVEQRQEFEHEYTPSPVSVRPRRKTMRNIRIPPREDDK